MPNRLAGQTSPYLLQHASNPVEWHPWDAEALELARRADRPIFLSIGYSACHWCHVMEHESFENGAIARLMNENFVCIKVDREERPDLDQIYMTAVQLMTGRGGWPMSVFLTPELKPFYGGTYWPPSARGGMPGFDQVLLAVADAWANRRGQAIEQADSLTEHVKLFSIPQGDPAELDQSLIGDAIATLHKSFDATHGGFGRAPKFPHPMDLRLLLRAWRRSREPMLLEMVTGTLDRMAAGGMYDQLGGGFHRYSVDERWLVPHFEKMLYDNALLVPCYLEAFQVTKEERYVRVARETCDYVLREMTDPRGGFYSTQDADSEGQEGKFFVWTLEELEATLGAPAAETFAKVYGVTREGNFEHGLSILHLTDTIEHWAGRVGGELVDLEAELGDSRAILLAVRQRRVRPGLDDKVLVSWNGLMIEALAMAAGTLGEPRYLAAAQSAGQFLIEALQAADGRLLHTWRNGKATLDAYLDDFASLSGALVSLYEADFDERWIDEAIKLVDRMLSDFQDTAQGGFFFTTERHEALIARQKDFYDNAVPSGNSLAALTLLRLAKLTGRETYQQAAVDTLRAATPLVRQSPMATGQMLLALDMHLGPTSEIVLLGNPGAKDTASALAELTRRFVPNRVLACRAQARVTNGCEALNPLFAGKKPLGPEPTVFICQDFACSEPIAGSDSVIAAWKRLANEAQSR